jgi:hypothetical protein
MFILRKVSCDILYVYYFVIDELNYLELNLFTVIYSEDSIS